jgi:predicted enzyme related to lactoylglutathione lyase
MDPPYGDDGWRWITMGFAGARTMLHFVKRPDDSPSDGPVLVLVDQVVDRLRTTGACILTEPKAAPWTPGQTIAEFRDCEGNRIVISKN